MIVPLTENWPPNDAGVPRPPASISWHSAQPTPSRAISDSASLPVVSAAKVTCCPLARRSTSAAGAWQRVQVDSMASVAPGRAASSWLTVAR